MGHVTTDMWHKKGDTWHMPQDSWHITHVWGENSLKNLNTLALTVGGLWCFEDLEEKDRLISQWRMCLYNSPGYTGSVNNLKRGDHWYASPHPPPPQYDHDHRSKGILFWISLLSPW